MDWEEVEVSYIAGTPFVGTNVKMYAGPGGHRGALTAWEPVAAKQVWSIKETFPVWSGAVATAGGVVFYGTMEGWFKAVHARTSEELWRFNAGSGVIGRPITYRGPDGKQYVAVLAGVGGWAGAIVAAGLDPRDRDSGPGVCQCHERPAGPHDQRGHALCLCTPMKDAHHHLYPTLSSSTRKKFDIVDRPHPQTSEGF